MMRIVGCVEKGKATELGMKEAIEAFQDRKCPVWIDIENPTSDEMKILEKDFGFHPLALEDAGNQYQRPKIDDYESYAYVVLRTLDMYDKKTMGQLNIFIGRMNYIVTIHLGPMRAIDVVRNRCLKNVGIMERGSDFIAYSLLDEIVDEFFPLIDEISDRIEYIDEKLVENSSSPTMLPGILEMRREILNIRKVVWPMRDIVAHMSRGDFPYVKRSNTVYFKDVYDHTLRIVDTIDTIRELLTGTMEAHLVMVSNVLNAIMKKLAAVATIMLVPTLVASIYGMNFQNMPELTWEYGYYGALGLMGAAAVLLFLYFRKLDWI